MEYAGEGEFFLCRGFQSDLSPAGSHQQCVIVFVCAANEVECVIPGGGWRINDGGGVKEVT